MTCLILLLLSIVLSQSEKTSCVSPYYFSPLSSVESSITLTPEQFSSQNINCNGQTQGNGMWIDIANHYDFTLSFQIIASEDITMQYYTDCSSVCQADNKEAFLVLSAGHHQLVYVSFNTPYNTIFFYPISQGTINNPIKVTDPFPKSIDTTLSMKDENGIYQSFVLLTVKEHWKYGINITSTLPITTKIQCSSISFNKTFTGQYIEFDSEQDNTQFLISFISPSITVIKVIFNQTFFLPTSIEEINVYPYIRYETVPPSSLPDSTEIFGYNYQINPQPNYQYFVDLCSSSDTNITFGLLSSDYKIQSLPCISSSGIKYSFNTSDSVNPFLFRIGFTSVSSNARTFILQVHNQKLDNSSPSSKIILTVSITSILFILICLILVTIICVLCLIKKKSKYTSIGEETYPTIITA
ncbi:hypothetical protein EHI8A_129490 [Entamoeba histolytica HM-1:IMSS-B]|uniref:Transmembrane protein n=6 Tax=Entamoeba histolytica TaxID=5759 RepID=C4M9S7_ENTH1|nr:hypothetical protein EHI_056620 [Entamoeba histolytica HM-1:IMSS]EMD45814.1 Hypothetical protein EHI5A_049060 [Entamoeba histolytica KU27]EMH72288.1 hypothetical protein EHI8A_129490 [Entamoeba histolytica HM-1:IMSS-B]EMS13819.1 hypothetical protein KM1_056720 [Entamoeba histolytica HM-3:IMSS]ENY60565.1 hypothetical protein EHI7A_025330 [Entamoeba histolytica HM-1:IMSS-A]EAL43710.1 hypothetical protein EHI_056620 [Entamoeba histolytica HM-1:IMSS]|eukprot:XP_649098.1 hypothetical protein EHI_056620 [Entamoeba histolytica HM-1:IMSS]